MGPCPARCAGEPEPNRVLLHLLPKLAPLSPRAGAGARLHNLPGCRSLFYSSPNPIFEEMEGKSVLIVPHRFPENQREKEKFGIYNVGWVSFRNDCIAKECLWWWRERCLEWCYDRVEPGRFGDQKYLDEWPHRFPGIHVLQHLGAGLGPWNWMAFRITVEGENAAVDGVPLIFYHFHGLSVFRRWLYDTGLPFEHPMQPSLRRWLYGRYVDTLRHTAESISGSSTHRIPYTDRQQLRHTPSRVASKLLRAVVGRFL